MTVISVEVVDCMHGRAADGVLVRLERQEEDRWSVVATGCTIGDGRVPALGDLRPEPGRHRLAVRPSGYFAGLGSVAHYQEFAVDFQITEVGAGLRLTIYLGPASFAAYCRQD